MQAPKIYYTNDLKNFFPKTLGYGQSGAGKTHLIGTAPRPYVISTENGLLTLRKIRVPYSIVTNEKELRDVRDWIMQSAEPRKNYDTICVDTISDIAETVLLDKKRTKKDARQAYGETQDLMFEFIKQMRDLQGLCLYMVATETMGKNTYGGMLAMPNMPDKRSMEMLPYKFDMVGHVQSFTQQDGSTIRAIKTVTDEKSLAKDRSSTLDFWERPDLLQIFKKLVS